MPLSEYESRVLAELAAQLDDARPAPRRPAAPLTPRRTVVAALLLLAGVAALLTGVIVAQPLVGVAGFVAMLAGGDQLAHPLLDRAASGPPQPEAAPAAAASSRYATAARIELAIVGITLSFILLLALASAQAQ